jgi:hypothetical protein
VVLPPDVFFQVIEDLSVKTVDPKPRVVNIIQGENWRASIMAYLHHYNEPDSSTESIRIQQRAKAYQIIEDELYKTSVTGSLLRCLSKDEGMCGGHIGARALTTKVFMQGFYWPSVIITTCQACQKFLSKTKAPSQPSQLITPSWPL